MQEENTPSDYNLHLTVVLNPLIMMLRFNSEVNSQNACSELYFWPLATFG